MVTCHPERTLLAVTENGFGKRTPFDEYPVQSRGGKGVITYRITPKTGNLAGVRAVKEDDDIMLISSDGTIIRMKVEEVSILGRPTQGVTLMRTAEDKKVVCVARIRSENGDENGDESRDEELNGNGYGDEYDEEYGYENGDESGYENEFENEAEDEDDNEIENEEE